MIKRAWINLFFLSAVATVGPAYAEDAMACEIQHGNFKKRDYLCLLTANGRGQPIVFTSSFTGSHDDTAVSMTLTLDGLPVSCGTGSKTWLNGEDGDVSLECHLLLDGTAGTKRVLRATVNIYHAQFAGVKLTRAEP